MADIAASAPAPDNSASAQPTDATVQSGAESQNQVTPEYSQSGGQSQDSAPPQDRWPTILENARRKARDEARAEADRRFEPYREYEQDPWSAVQKWLTRAEQHSIYGPMVRQHYQGRLRGTEQPVEPQPDVPIVDERGNITGKTYSADRLREWSQWNHRQNQAAIDERLTPLEAKARADAERDEYVARRQQADTHAYTVVADLRSKPYFKENEGKIRQALIDHEEWGSNLHQAYVHVLTTEILPHLKASEANEVLNSLTKQGDANTVSPGSTTVGKPKFKGFGDAARYFAEHPAEAAAMANR